jgi:hypothetical protein
VLAEAQSHQGPAKVHERHLVPSSIVDPHAGAPGLCHIAVQLVLRPLDFLGYQFVQEARSEVVGLIVPVLKGPVAVSHGLLDRRSLIQQLFESLEPRLEDAELLGVRSVGYLLGEDGLGGEASTF